MELGKLGVTTIERYGFAGCINLIKADLSKIDTINYSSFESCINFAGDGNGDLRLPSLISIGNEAFGGYKVQCIGLRRIFDLGSITILPDAADNYSGVFRNQINLTEVHLPETLKTIGSCCFQDCTSLADINFPSSLTTIKAYAFSGCTTLEIEDLSLPNLETIGLCAFSGVKITKISNLGKLTSLQNINGDQNIFGNKTTLVSVNLPSTLTSIGNYVFNKYSSLTSINFPSSLTRIGWNAFEKCTSLTNVNFSSSITSIKDYTFSDCTALKSINLPLSLTNIGNHTFKNCSALTNINLPASLTTIGSYAFSNCISIAGIIDLPNLETLGQDAFCISDSKTGSLTGIENLGKITAINNATNGS